MATLIPADQLRNGDVFTFLDRNGAHTLRQVTGIDTVRSVETYDVVHYRTVPVDPAQPGNGRGQLFLRDSDVQVNRLDLSPTSAVVVGLTGLAEGDHFTVWHGPDGRLYT